MSTNGQPNTHQSAQSGRSRVEAQWLDYEPKSHTMSWMVSYADIMTIILTFFVLLLSISSIAQNKFDLLVESMTGRQVGNLREVKARIDEVVEHQSLGGQVGTKIDEDGLKVEFANALLFDSGQAELNPKAAEILEPISAHLVENLEPQYGITIEGYTDDIPISNGRYQSNWELSTNRAIHVMKRLQQAGLGAKRMSVQGFADTRSATDVDLHDTTAVESLSAEERAKARAANRRVVLRIHPLGADIVEDVIKDVADNAAPEDVTDAEQDPNAVQADPSAVQADSDAAQEDSHAVQQDKPRPAKSSHEPKD